ncbi:MAG: phage Gp37/Gp68 family protein [Bryobacterales bacterium]|nr:phage Gp37/Gp68 family protein [Bryobacterales bacterium]
MAIGSTIEWTEVTWNPVTGCSKVSDGCKHCYAERMANRLLAMGVEKYQNGFSVSIHPSSLGEPLEWRRPRLVFVNSMSDLFHQSVPEVFVRSVFETMNRASHHTFQVLTKRPGRAASLSNSLDWTPNIWLGTSIESDAVLGRLPLLKESGALTKFLSLEPLLSPLPNLDLSGIGWVIVGGESGPGARPMHADWVREIRDACVEAAVPFFFKQWGGVFKKQTGRTLDGRTWDEMPMRSQS